jgi:hypothetical protein
VRSTDAVTSTARRLRRRALLGAALALAGAVLPSTMAAADLTQTEPLGGIGLRLVDAPLAGAEDARARVYIVDHLAPGTTIERRIEVSNSSGAPQDIVLYPAAATIDDGTFLGAAGRTLNDVASWTTVTPASSTLAAGASMLALVTLAVPADAPPGEQYGVVWAEVRSAPTTAGGVGQVSRVGLRLYISVGPGGAPPSDFSIESLTAARTTDGAPFVTATVKNTGGRALDMTGDLDLSNGPGGLAAGPFPADLGSTLAIGDTRKVRVTLDEALPDGPWDAVITLESGLIKRRAEARLTFPVAGEAAAVAVTEPRSGPPWRLLVGAAGLLLLVLVMGWGARRRRSDRHRPAHAAPSAARAA